MPSFPMTAVLWLRAFLLVAAGLSCDGLVTEAHARCGGLPHHLSSEDRVPISIGGQQRPAPPRPRCHGPSCSEAPLPAAPVVVSIHRVSDGVLAPAAALPCLDQDEVAPGADEIALVPTLSSGVFRPPRA